MRAALGVIAAVLASLGLFVLPVGTMWSGWTGGLALGIAFALVATDHERANRPR